MQRPQPADGDKPPTRIFHADAWGLRQQKYDYLAANDLTTTEWQQLAPTAPGFYFVPKDFGLDENEYLSLPSVNADIFDKGNAGIQTKQDNVVYQFYQQDLKDLIDDLKDSSNVDFAAKYKASLSGNWTVKEAQTDALHNSGVVVQALRRPFDIRWTYYTGKKGLMARPRQPEMGNALKQNLLFLTVRNPRRGNTDSFFVADKIVDKDAVSPLDNATFYPLYLYPTPQEQQLGMTERRANLKPQFVAAVTERLGLSFIGDGKGDLTATFGPEDIFHYMYAIFHSPEYRRRYAELLKTDYPRLPLTSDRALFAQLCGLGERLVGLHLLKPTPMPTSTYPVSRLDNTNPVTQPRYEPGDGGHIHINDTQYFGNVPPDVWEFQIGGYQVAKKWLKDRKGRDLKPDDLKHYRQVLAALAATISTMVEVDDAITAAGGWPLA